MAPDGHAVAYDVTTVGGEMMRGTWCDIYYATLDEREPEPVFHMDGKCDQGYAIVGTTLWLALP